MPPAELLHDLPEKTYEVNAGYRAAENRKRPQPRIADQHVQSEASRAGAGAGSGAVRPFGVAAVNNSIIERAYLQPESHHTRRGRRDELDLPVID